MCIRDSFHGAAGLDAAVEVIRDFQSCFHGLQFAVLLYAVERGHSERKGELGMPQQLPMFSRSAIQASGIVVCDRNSQAKATFLGSPRFHLLHHFQPLAFSLSSVGPTRPTTGPPAATSDAATAPPNTADNCSRQKPTALGPA